MKHHFSIAAKNHLNSSNFLGRQLISQLSALRIKVKIIKKGQDMAGLRGKTMKLLEEGLPIITEAVLKARRNLDTGENLDILERMNAYTTVYNLGINLPDEDSPFVMNYLYNEIYKPALEERIKEKALPSLENKHGMLFLRELVRLWSDYFKFTQSLIVIFRPMESKGPFYGVFPSSLIQISVLRFCDMIWGRFFGRIDEVLLHKVGSGALVEGRPNDHDAQLIKRMMNFFGHMYRVHSRPEKYINMVTERIRAQLRGNR